jgi:predicted O-linked N-acetylglucosamine transferase (SPINDLY family)
MGILIQSAVEAHKAGRTDEALAIYEKILEADPSIARIQYLAGCLLMDKKRFEEAYEHLEAAVRLKDTSPTYCGAFGSLLLQMNRRDSALEYLRKAVGLNGASEEVFHALCNALLRMERYDEAYKVASEAMDRFPSGVRILKDFFECCLATGNGDELNRAIEIGKKNNIVNAEMALSLEYRLASLGENGAASLEAAERWAKECPDSVDALKACVRANLANKQEDRAAEVICAIYEKFPDDKDANAWMAKNLVKDGRYYEASRFFERALKCDPDNKDLLGSAAFSLYKCAESPSHGDKVEEAYYYFCRLHETHRTDLRSTIGMSSLLLNMLRIREGLLYFDKAVREYPKVYANISSRLFHDCYGWYFSKEEMYARHMECVKTIREMVGVAETSFDNQPDPAKRLKVGFVSGDFSFHPVAYFFISAFESIKDDFDTYIYSNKKKEDEDDLTRRFQNGAKVFRNISEVSDQDFQTMAKEDGIDVMIDLSGHTSFNRLRGFAIRLAPVQASWLGYPNTTGLETMDFRISDDVTEPEGLMDDFSSERIIRLPGGFHLYRPPYSVPETVVPLPALKNKCITFGSFNNLKKASPLTFEAWSTLLREIPNSRMVIKDRNLEGKYMRERVMSIFASYGVESSRITVIRLMRNNFDHMSAYNNVDIALDCYPYNGTTTTCEALVMGCPVVTRQGDSHVSRVSSSILTHVGHPEWIAHDMDEFVAIGKKLASDTKVLAAIRSKLRSEMYASPLCDPQRMRRELGDAIRFMWRDWCSRSQKSRQLASPVTSNN